MYITDDQFNTNGFCGDDNLGDGEHNRCDGCCDDSKKYSCADRNNILCTQDWMCSELLQKQYHGMQHMCQFDDRWIL